MNFKREIKRKLFHLLALSIPVGYWFLDRSLVLMILIPFTVIVLIVDIARFNIPWFQDLFMKIFGVIVREHETRYFTGSAFLLSAAVIVIHFFPKNIAILSLLIVSISDACAALIGRKFGKISIFEKTLEGSLAFLTTALMIGFIMPDIDNFHGITAAVSATVIELIPVPIDDNLLIPVGTCLILYFL
ncbi:MAG: phosphatidate cytidylyltransferase [bacterium]|nr:phosphatidate cytidylyltransferase [bacterium]